MRTGNAKQGTVTRHVIAISRGITATATRRSNEPLPSRARRSSRLRAAADAAHATRRLDSVCACAVGGRRR